MAAQTIGIQSQEPILFLHVSLDVDHCRSELDAIGVFKFFEEDLYGLAVRCALRDQVKAFGVLDIIRGIVAI